MKWTRLALVLALAAGFAACGDDSSTGKGDGGNDAGGENDSGAKDKDSGANDKDAGKGKDAAVDAATGDDSGVSEGMKFEVPSAGGTFKFQAASGAMVSFKFPASAAGKNITIADTDPAKVAWGTTANKDAFSDALVLGPDGTTFTDPVEVTLDGKALIAFNFSDVEGVGDPLLFSGGKLLLKHFSTLGIVAPNQSCESESGWSDDDGSARCSSYGAATTFRHYGCKYYQFCYTIEAGCCVEPGDTDVDCKTDDQNITLLYHRVGSNGGNYTYCDSIGGIGSEPYVQSVSPASLIANSQDQTIVITGTGFTAGGTAFTNSDGPITTTSITATEVHATVPGSLLTAAGTLNNVGFVPANGQSFNWNLRSNMVNIPINAPASSCPVPEVGASPIGLCTINSASDCNCGMDYDSGGGYHTYEIVCSGSQCECKRDSSIINDGAIGGACANKAALQAMWTSLCAPAQGFCP